MELDELKNRWALLETKPGEHESLNEKILREIYKTRHNRSLSQLINYTFLGCVGCILFIFALVYRLSSVYFGPFKTTLFLLAIAFIFCVFVIEISNLKLLYKIDYSKPVSHNIAMTRKYQIRIKRQSLAIYICVVVFLVSAIIACVLSPEMELWRWFVIGGIIAFGAVTAAWEYKRMYMKNISSVLKSLDELKELEE